MAKAETMFTPRRAYGNVSTRIHVFERKHSVCAKAFIQRSHYIAERFVLRFFSFKMYFEMYFIFDCKE